MLNKELRDVRDLGLRSGAAELPHHLAGVPECLHKYGPLFAEQPRLGQLSDGASAA